MDRARMMSNETHLWGGVIDPSAGFAYFGINAQFPAPFVTKFSIAPHFAAKLEYGEKVSTCSAISSWTPVPSAATTEHWEMAPSANITNGGLTTDLAGLPNGNTSFAPGRIQDTDAPAIEVGLGREQFTELEYSVSPTDDATAGGDYCFRLTNAGDDSVFSYVEYAEATVLAGGGSNDPTLQNRVLMSRLKAGVVSNVDVSFLLQNTPDGTLTITFPVGFTVTGAFTSGTCSGGGTVDTFGFTSSTLTAEKHSCAGTLELQGATVTNPSSPGRYLITWVNDDPGGGEIFIMDDDQVTVTADVNATLAFDIDVQATCGSESAAPYAVPLGTLSPTAVTTSASRICLDLDTNAAAGAVVTLQGSGAADGLESAGTGGTIGTAYGTQTDLLAGVAGFGVCVAAVSTVTGSATAVAPYNGVCDAAGGNRVGGVSASAPQHLLTTAGGPVDGALNQTAEILVKAVVSTTTPAANDYTDVFTFIATGTF